jgi:hypothetical protein
MIPFLQGHISLTGYFISFGHIELEFYLISLQTGCLINSGETGSGDEK